MPRPPRGFGHKGEFELRAVDATPHRRRNISPPRTPCRLRGTLHSHLKITICITHAPVVTEAVAVKLPAALMIRSSAMSLSVGVMIRAVNPVPAARVTFATMLAPKTSAFVAAVVAAPLL